MAPQPARATRRARSRFAASAGAFRAEEVEGEQRERIWNEVLLTYPGYATYEKRAAPRRISVFVLHRA